jgi:hypothetical protein
VLRVKPQNTESVCTTREKETDRDTFFFKKIVPQKIKIKNKKNDLLTGHRAEVTCCPVNRVPI